MITCNEASAMFLAWHYVSIAALWRTLAGLLVGSPGAFLSLVVLLVSLAMQIVSWRIVERCPTELRSS